jgi:lysozyme
MNNYTTNDLGVQLIKSFETLHDGDLTQIGLQPKLCPANVWTEGYGHAIIYRGKALKGGHNKELAYLVSTVKTEKEAEALLAKDLKEREDIIRKYVKVPLTSNQFSALVSFVFNVGEANFATSTLLKRLNAGDYVGASEELRKWINVNKKPLKGLVRRRAAERHLFTLTDEKELIEAIATLSKPLPMEELGKLNNKRSV